MMISKQIEVADIIITHSKKIKNSQINLTQEIKSLVIITQKKKRKRKK